MHHIDHSPNGNYKVAILIKDTALRQQPLIENYLNKIEEKEVVSFSLEYQGRKKTTAKIRKDYLETLLKAVNSLNINYLLCADGDYFKTLTGAKKTEPYYGLVVPCNIKGYEHISVCLVPNYQALIYNPDMVSKIDLSINALNQALKGTYVELGKDIIKYVDYPSTLGSIKAWLNKLLTYDVITSDIEAFSLKHYEAGIGTISFAWNEHEGIGFCVDYEELEEPTLIDVWDASDKKFKKRIAYGRQTFNKEVRALLKEFFINYKGKIIWHNAGYDVSVLIYQLWMKDLTDQDGLNEGLEIMHKHTEDTKLIAYLATNSCVGNRLGLKEQAHEFAGNYAEDDIVDIRLIQKDRLLKYNVVDTLCTWYVADKHYPTVILDNQYDLYRDFLAYLKDILEMQLTGMCISMPKVKEAHTQLKDIRDSALKNILAEPLIKQFMQKEKEDFLNLRNSKLKTKQLTIDEVSVDFKPNSPKQMSRLLYEFLNLPVIDVSKDTKEPSTGAKTIKKLINHTEDERYIRILKHLMDYSASEKIISTFILKFLAAPMAKSGKHYIFGSYNLGGTVSGRLSASGGINMQTIPSGSTYAKLIKECFIAEDGWLFGGADFASLEDRISALTTKDPNKLKIYTDGFDGHSYRALNYWSDQFPEIDRNDPEQVNTLDSTEEGDKLRSRSKAPTFLLTYKGTYLGLMQNCGFPEFEAKTIVKNFDKLYQVSIEWVQEHIDKAANTGFVECAFGLRVRTPLIRRSILGSSVTPKEVAAETRTAGNALGQSWCLLTNRAAREFMEKVRNSKYRNSIRICSQIHDAIYLYFKDDIEVIHWVNTTLGKAMSWQEHPLIQHDEVKLYGELDIFYPTWKNPITLKNGISKQEIVNTIKKEAEKRLENDSKNT